MLLLALFTCPRRGESHELEKCSNCCVAFGYHYSQPAANFNDDNDHNDKFRDHFDCDIFFEWLADVLLTKCSRSCLSHSTTTTRQTDIRNGTKKINKISEVEIALETTWRDHVLAFACFILFSILSAVIISFPPQ